MLLAKNPKTAHFHIPVMGTGFSIDRDQSGALRDLVCHFAVDDSLIEDVRKVTVKKR